MRIDPYLRELERKSIFIIREAYWQYRDKLAILWSMGKDSTTLVHLCRKAFLGRIPVPVMHIDTTRKFREIYDFRERYAKEWGLDLIVASNRQALAAGVSPEKGRFACCNLLKTEALKREMERREFRALLLAIRRDEHAIRAKERYFSMRDREFKWEYKDQPMELWTEYYGARNGGDTHVRVHPLLHWREIDVWRYIRQEKIPTVSLYFAVRERRYRSIGCDCCCEPVVSQADSIDKIISELRSTAVPERAGRKQDREAEYVMQKLRALGYM